MTPYSQDLRQRILDTVQRGEGSLRQIARRFLVSISFVTRLLHRHRSTGSLQPKPHGGGNPAVLGPEDLERLRELVPQQPDAIEISRENSLAVRRVRDPAHVRPVLLEAEQLRAAERIPNPGRHVP